jgi:hypothetical protein
MCPRIIEAITRYTRWTRRRDLIVTAAPSASVHVSGVVVPCYPDDVGVEVKTRVSTITLREDGVVHVNCLAGVEFCEADAHETLAKIDQLTGDRPAVHCVDLSQIKSMERACRSVFANGKNTQAAALIVATPLSRVIGNFFLGLTKTRFPLRLFSEVEPAIAWLHTNRG